MDGWIDRWCLETVSVFTRQPTLFSDLAHQDIRKYTRRGVSINRQPPPTIMSKRKHEDETEDERRIRKQEKKLKKEKKEKRRQEKEATAADSTLPLSPRPSTCL